jgi:hypothetical protein
LEDNLYQIITRKASNSMNIPFVIFDLFMTGGFVAGCMSLKGNTAEIYESATDLWHIV